MTKKEFELLEKISNQAKPWFVTAQLKEALKTFEITEEPKGNRTSAQNSSIHLWLTQVAEELDKHGHTIQNVVQQIKQAEIRPTGKNLKEILWRPYQIAALQKDSTTKLNKLEVDKVYEGLNKFLGEHFQIHIPFPVDEKKQLGGYKSDADTHKKGYEDMSEMTNADRF